MVASSFLHNFSCWVRDSNAKFLKSMLYMSQYLVAVFFLILASYSGLLYVQYRMKIV